MVSPYFKISFFHSTFLLRQLGRVLNIRKAWLEKKDPNAFKKKTKQKNPANSLVCYQGHTILKDPVLPPTSTTSSFSHSVSLYFSHMDQLPFYKHTTDIITVYPCSYCSPHFKFSFLPPSQSLETKVYILSITFL